MRSRRLGISLGILRAACILPICFAPAVGAQSRGQPASSAAIVSPDGGYAYRTPSERAALDAMSRAPAFYPYLALNPANERKVTALSPRVYKVEPWPQAGYNYDYYIYVPPSYPGLKLGRLLAISIASGGEQGRGPAYYSDWVKNVVMRGNWETQVADMLGAPLVMPAFDRPLNSSLASLTLDAAKATHERYARLDLQYLAMIDDARAFLKAERGIELDSRVLLAGYSMSGSFAERFALMHPERVQAAAYGGMSCRHILPYTEDTVYGQRLSFPAGVEDIESISGKAFDREAYLAIPKFYFEGALDFEDITRYDGLFPAELRPWLDARVGKALDARWPVTAKLLREAHSAIELKRYPQLGHDLDAFDIAKFLARANGVELKITATDQGAQRVGQAPVQGVALFGTLAARLGGKIVDDLSTWEIIVHTDPRRIYETRLTNQTGYSSINPNAAGNWKAEFPTLKPGTTLYFYVGKNFNGEFIGQAMELTITVSGQNLGPIELRFDK